MNITNTVIDQKMNHMSDVGQIFVLITILLSNQAY